MVWVTTSVLHWILSFHRERATTHIPTQQHLISFIIKIISPFSARQLLPSIWHMYVWRLTCLDWYVAWRCLCNESTCSRLGFIFVEVFWLAGLLVSLSLRSLIHKNISLHSSTFIIPICQCTRWRYRHCGELLDGRTYLRPWWSWLFYFHFTGPKLQHIGSSQSAIMWGDCTMYQLANGHTQKKRSDPKSYSATTDKSSMSPSAVTFVSASDIIANGSFRPAVTH